MELHGVGEADDDGEPARHERLQELQELRPARRLTARGRRKAELLGCWGESAVFDAPEPGA